MPSDVGRPGGRVQSHLPERGFQAAGGGEKSGQGRQPRLGAALAPDPVDLVGGSPGDRQIFLARIGLDPVAIRIAFDISS